MANPTTAAEWTQVAANAQTELDAVNQQRVQGEQQITALENQLLAQNQKISEYLAANPIFDRATLRALEAQATAIRSNLDKTVVYVRSTLVSQTFQLRATINNANRQAGVASTGAPNTSTNAPPETVVPDQSNTAVTTTTEPEPVQQSVIDPNSDPNTNIGAEGQDVTGFEPLQGPPGTTDGDEFDGIDAQVANNENGLQEPPQLSEEEIEQQLRLAAAQEETITSPDSITENVFDPRQEVTENVFDPRQEVQESVFDPSDGGSGGATKGLTGPKTNTQSQATQQDTDNFYQTGDWRVRLSLAPSANYLYKAKGNEGILLPLAATNGIIFPYTPNISVNYAAQYDPAEITHSNYKTFQYKSSSVDSFSMTCDFTAQDTFEANYLLAVIHFLRSVTKMFYGQDENPKNGTPPPLCYLTGLGAFQFDRHPLAITSFTYSLPTDVDYIRATNTTTSGGVNKSESNIPINTTDVSSQRLGGLPSGGGSGPVNWQNTNSGSREPTYVPTKMQIQISAVPIVTRNDISRNFSLKDYATGNLLRGSKRKQGGGGIW